MNEAVVDPRVFRFGKAGVATGVGCISSPLMAENTPCLADANLYCG